MSHSQGCVMTDEQAQAGAEEPREEEGPPDVIIPPPPHPEASLLLERVRAAAKELAPVATKYPSLSVNLLSLEVVRQASLLSGRPIRRFIYPNDPSPTCIESVADECWSLNAARRPATPEEVEASKERNPL